MGREEEQVKNIDVRHPELVPAFGVERRWGLGRAIGLRCGLDAETSSA
jgi:hypothetical protein